MKTSLNTNKYYIESINKSINKSMNTRMNTSSFSSVKNTDENLEGQKASYQAIQEKEIEKLEKYENLNNSITDNGDEVWEGIIITESLKKQIEANHSKKDNRENNTQTSFQVYTCDGLNNTIW